MQNRLVLCIIIAGFYSIAAFNFNIKSATAPCTNIQLPKISIQSFAASVIGPIIGASLFVGIAGASTELKTYTNERYHTVLSYPADFEIKTGQLSGERDVIAFTDPNDPDTSASLVFSPVPADYTRLTSFGAGKDTLRQYLLPTGEGSCDMIASFEWLHIGYNNNVSNIRVTSEVIEEFVKGETYTLEYIVSAPDAPKRHIQSVFALRPQESVIGLTVQTKQDTYEKMKEKLSPVVPSLKVNVGDSPK